MAETLLQPHESGSQQEAGPLQGTSDPWGLFWAIIAPGLGDSGNLLLGLSAQRPGWKWGGAESRPAHRRASSSKVPVGPSGRNTEGKGCVLSEGLKRPSPAALQLSAQRRQRGPGVLPQPPALTLPGPGQPGALCPHSLRFSLCSSNALAPAAHSARSVCPPPPCYLVLSSSPQGRSLPPAPSLVTRHPCQAWSL